MNNAFYSVGSFNSHALDILILLMDSNHRIQNFWSQILDFVGSVESKLVSTKISPNFVRSKWVPCRVLCF